MEAVLKPWHLALLAETRRATLATIGSAGRPRLVPCCFALRPARDDSGPRLVLPLDEKAKRVTDPRELARVRDVARDPRVTLLVDRWSEDWSGLAWLRLEGVASLVEPAGDGASEHRDGLAALRERYPQYLSQALETRPLIRIDVERVSGWRARG